MEVIGDEDPQRAEGVGCDRWGLLEHRCLISGTADDPLEAGDSRDDLLKRALRQEDGRCREEGRSLRQQISHDLARLGVVQQAAPQRFAIERAAVAVAIQCRCVRWIRQGFDLGLLLWGHA